MRKYSEYVCMYKLSFRKTAMRLFVIFEGDFGLELQSTFTRVYESVWIVNVLNVVSCIA